MDLTNLSVTGYQSHSVSIELSMALYKQNVSQIQLRQALKTISFEMGGRGPSISKRTFFITVREKLFHLCQLVTFSTLILSVSVSVQAGGLDFKPFLSVGEQMKYHHWNVKEKKATGYTFIHVKNKIIGNRKYILAITQNQDEKGKLYLEKRSWFESDSGKLSRYTERDLRTGIQITNTFENKEITTRIDMNGKINKLAISAEQDIVPFEVLTLYLRKELNRLLKDGQITFVLYLPIIASELAKKGLPLSLSNLSMIASVESKPAVDSILGRIKTVQILVTPGSLLLTAFLPKEKSEFRFIFGLQAPHYLLSFEEGETRSELTQYKNLKQ